LPLKKGMKMIDVGCGFGYNGWTYAPYFLKGGSYSGIDISKKLIEEAKENAINWSNGESVEFQIGDVHNLPFDDNQADITICQTLMMHLENPEKALKEMIRVTTKGGLIVCVEPDNLSSSMRVNYSSLPDIPIEDRLLFQRVRLIQYEGHKKLGLGDYAIGNKIPKMMMEAGLDKIELRNNDKVYLLQYPYDNVEQKQHLMMLEKHLDKNDDKEEKGNFKKAKEMFIAGGGTEYMFRKYKKIAKKYKRKMEKIVKEQLKDETYFSCSCGSNFYVIRGIKN
ncbi:MAG: class I SAM-dependent methyltransferase, partial [Candidatus Cloacimonadota bacterium]|nr:class I SAM-dependent methyltransferase [Candidatus Cloacimonadota bacterium]